MAGISKNNYEVIIEIDYREIADMSRYNIIKKLSNAFREEISKRVTGGEEIDRHAGARETKEAPIRLISLED
jgi:hypothetical protein